MNQSPAEDINANILIVDDILANRRLLSSILTSKGYTISDALDGETALKKAREQQPDLILLDIRMPVMDGYEVCRRLKADEKTRNIPVVFVSALDSQADKTLGFELGGLDYITKPFQVKEVLARVGTQLALHKLQKQLAEQNAQLEQEITQRKQAEAELQKTQALLHAAVLQSPSGILIADAPDVRIRLVNPAALGIRGKTDKPLTDIDVSKHAEHWKPYYPDGRPYASEDLPLSRAVLKGEVSENI